MSDRYTIVGAGLGGALMACYLGRDGHRVDILERRDDPRGTGGGEGRSINLAISTRAIRAFEEVGIADTVLADAVPMKGRMMHDTTGQLSYQAYGTEPHHFINSVSRGGLNCALLDAAEKYEGVTTRFDTAVNDLSLDDGRVTYETHGSVTRTEPSVIVGADGAFSAVRQRLQRSTRLAFDQSWLEHGYKELTIPPAKGGGFQMEPHALHIWPRGGFMMIALPNPDGSFTCTLFWPFSGPHGLETLQTPEAVTAFFTEHFPDAVPLMPTLTEDYLQNPNSGLVTVRCAPWYHQDRVVLLGDACHAIVPFYGQGANAAFEDCRVLHDCLMRHPEDHAAAFHAYFQARKEDADTLADLAIANFLEMRDHVASPLFLMRKRWEKRLHRMFPRWYVPIYSMVTFSTMSYTEAVVRAARQDRAVVGVLFFIAMMMVLGVLVWL